MFGDLISMSGNKPSQNTFQVVRQTGRVKNTKVYIATGVNSRQSNKNIE